MQIGWASPHFRPAPGEGLGVGDDAHSWAFDGLRRRFWHGAFQRYGTGWRQGDVLGVALAVDPAPPTGARVGTFRFFLNGTDLGCAAFKVLGPRAQRSTG